jgi:hypothetical protein
VFLVRQGLAVGREGNLLGWTLSNNNFKTLQILYGVVSTARSMVPSSNVQVMEEVMRESSCLEPPKELGW